MICPAFWGVALVTDRFRPVSWQTTRFWTLPPAKAVKSTSKWHELPAASVATTGPAPWRPGVDGGTRQVAIGVGEARVPQAAGNGAPHVRLTLVALTRAIVMIPVSAGPLSVEVPSKPRTPARIDFTAVQIGDTVSLATQVRL